MSLFLIRWADGRTALMSANDEGDLAKRIFDYDSEFETDPRTTFIKPFTDPVTIVFNPPPTVRHRGEDPDHAYTDITRAMADGRDGSPLCLQQSQFNISVVGQAFPLLYGAIEMGSDPGTQRVTLLMQQDLTITPPGWTRLADLCNKEWLGEYYRDFSDFQRGVSKPLSEEAQASATMVRGLLAQVEGIYAESAREGNRVLKEGTGEA